MMKNVQFLLALHSIDGLGPIRLKAVIDFYQDPQLAWQADPKELKQIGIPEKVTGTLVEKRKNLDPEKLLEQYQKNGMKWVSIYDEEYPKLLKQIYDPPTILYFKGEILPSDSKSVAVVGSRKMTGYGGSVTTQFTQGLVQVGLTIVSGLARGVDTKAHQTAVKEKGRTLAVLGGGLDSIFPPENTNLASEIASGFGAVLSEFPPDYPSLPGNFPSRNRIISGLSLGVLVTEAAEDSGSLITARLALEQGRDVFAVPGPVTSWLSKGPVDLIKEGAKVVFGPEDVLEELGMNKMPIRGVQPQSNIELSESERLVLDSLNTDSLHVDEICRLSKLPTSTVSATLLKMEIQGLVRNLGAGVYCKS